MRDKFVVDTQDEKYVYIIFMDRKFFLDNLFTVILKESCTYIVENRCDIKFVLFCKNVLIRNKDINFSS